MNFMIYFSNVNKERSTFPPGKLDVKSSNCPNSVL